MQNRKLFVNSCVLSKSVRVRERKNMSTMHSRCNMLERSALLIVIVFIASTCSVWQENVRPKLYVELGKSWALLSYILFCIMYIYDPIDASAHVSLCCRNRIQNRRILEDKEENGETRNEIMYCGIWISFDFIRVENNATSSRFLLTCHSSFRYLFISNFFVISCRVFCEKRERKIDECVCLSAWTRNQCLSYFGTTSTMAMYDDDLEQSYLLTFNSEVNSIFDFAFCLSHEFISTDVVVRRWVQENCSTLFLFQRCCSSIRSTVSYLHGSLRQFRARSLAYRAAPCFLVQIYGDFVWCFYWIYFWVNFSWT